MTDDEYGEKTVSVSLDGQEAELNFIDHPSNEMGVENIISTYEPQACMVVYSIIDKESYAKAEETLQYLETQKRESGISRAKILVPSAFSSYFLGLNGNDLSGW